MPYNTEEIIPAYKSKHNLKRKNQVIFLMITDGEKWHYLAVKKLSALVRGITSKDEGEFCCLNLFDSYSTKDKLKKRKDVCENHDYCYIEMPKEDNKILKYNNGEKSVKIPFIINADMECLVERIVTCHNNHKRSPITKITKHLASAYSVFTHCSVDATKNRLDYYRGKDCMKYFSKDLKEHATKIIN